MNGNWNEFRNENALKSSRFVFSNANAKPFYFSHTYAMWTRHIWNSVYVMTNFLIVDRWFSFFMWPPHNMHIHSIPNKPCSLIISFTYLLLIMYRQSHINDSICGYSASFHVHFVFFFAGSVASPHACEVDDTVLPIKTIPARFICGFLPIIIDWTSPIDVRRRTLHITHPIDICLKWLPIGQTNVSRNGQMCVHVFRTFLNLCGWDTEMSNAKHHWTSDFCKMGY